MDTQDPITTEEIERCIKLLSRLTEDASLVATIEYAKFLTLSEAAGRFSRPHKTEIQKRHKALYIARKKKGPNGRPSSAGYHRNSRSKDC